MIKIAPSILSANLLDFKNQIEMVDQAGADYIHVDIMDGHYVQNITFGPNIVKSLKKITNKTLDVHLMIKPVLNFVQEFIDAGADIISFHPEADDDHNKIFDIISKSSCKPAIAIHPDVNVKNIETLLSKIDLVVVMTVMPGFGGQKFMESQLIKIIELAKYREDHNLNFEIEVDGGINNETSKNCIKNGADVLVAGSYIFSQKKEKYNNLIESLR